MKSFIREHVAKIAGVLSGWDRIRFRGTFRQLAHATGMSGVLSYCSVLLKDFPRFAEDRTARLVASVEKVAATAGRPVRYLQSSQVRKEELVDRIAEEEGPAKGGLLAAFRAVEVCKSYSVRGNRSTKKLELRPETRKCLHYYLYFQDSMFGRTQVRIQSWLPFNIHVVINGREWLARQMDAKGLAYQRRDNSFPWIADFAQAQKLMDRQLRTAWPKHLDRLLFRACPELKNPLPPLSVQAYWSAEETEWATDVVFRRRRDLTELYPRLVHHAMIAFDSREVLRFLGRKVPVHGGVHGRFAGEVISDQKSRPEGVRIKHRVNGNSVKMYDKQATMLRVETTINQPRDLAVYRAKEGEPDGPKSYRRLRKGVADLQRRARLCQQANERYLAGLSSADLSTPLQRWTDKLCRPVQRQGRRHRGLRPFDAADAQLLQTILRGEFLITGFRNRDLRQALFGAEPADPLERRRQAGRISRRLALLRAHRLIRRVGKTHRYLVSARGRLTLPILIALPQTTLDKLRPVA